MTCEDDDVFNIYKILKCLNRKESNLESNWMTLESYPRALASSSSGIEMYPHLIELESAFDGIEGHGIPIHWD